MVDGDEEENFKIGLKLQRKYAKFSLSIASFTSKLINDSLKSGFCNARQQKRQNISIILQNSRLFTKTTFLSFYHLTYSHFPRIKSCQALLEQLLSSAVFLFPVLSWCGFCGSLHFQRGSSGFLCEFTLPAFLCLRLISALAWCCSVTHSFVWDFF